MSRKKAAAWLGAIVLVAAAPLVGFLKAGQFLVAPALAPVKAELLASLDCVVIATDHDAFDYGLIAAHAPLIVDTRGRYAAAKGNIVKA